MATPNALTPGTRLFDRYVLGNALVVSRQSIAYAAWDEQMEQRVIITEFYPSVIVRRVQGEVQPQRNQVQFQAAMSRYHAYDGQQVLPFEQAFFGKGTAYRVYLPDEQLHLRAQADMLLDQPILFRSESGQAQMTINALMIDPLPKERPFTRAGNPGRKKKKKILTAILSLLLLLVIGCVVVLPMLGEPIQIAEPANTSEVVSNVQEAEDDAVPASAPEATEPTLEEATATPAPEATEPTTEEATATPVPEATEATVEEATATPAPEATEPTPEEATAAPVPEATEPTSEEATATPAPESTEATAEEVTATPVPEVPEVTAEEATSTPATSVPATEVTEVPAATDVPETSPAVLEITAEPGQESSQESWYLKVNGQLLCVDANGTPVEVEDDVAGLALDTIAITDLNEYWEIYDLNKMCLRNETGAEIDLSSYGSRVTLELPRGDYVLILGKTADVLADQSDLYQKEFPFASDIQSFSVASDDYAIWYETIEQAEQVEQLKQLNAGFYSIEERYYRIDTNGLLHELDDEQADHFYLVGTAEETQPEVRIPLYPVEVELDRNLFVKALLANMDLENPAGELVIFDKLLAADGNTIFYASQGDYALKLTVSDSLSIGDSQPGVIPFSFSVEENGEPPVLDDARMKAEVFEKFGLWAYQLGENAPVICGGDPEENQEQLALIFGSLLEQDAAFALHEVSFAHVNIGGKSLMSGGARVMRDDVVIPLAKLLQSSPDALLSENADVAAEEAAAAPVQSLKLTNGTYALYPTAEDALVIELTVNGSTDVTLPAEQQQTLLRKIAEKGVGYIAGVEADGLFIYQLDDSQLKLTAAEVSALDAETMSAQQKYKVTIDCAPRDMTTAEKASMGIVFAGREEIANPAELEFEVNDELKKLEVVDLKELAAWDGEKMTLLLGPGVYRLCYTGANEEKNELIVRFSAPFVVGEDLTLKLADECEHKQVKEHHDAPTCTVDGELRKKCDRCGKIVETKKLKASGHNMLAPTCTEPATCTVCGAQNSSQHPALGHEPGPAATCTEPQTCQRCGVELQMATGHRYTAWETKTEADCTKGGIEERACAACGVKESRDTRSLGHTTQQGTCTRCNATIGQLSSDGGSEELEEKTE